MSSVRLNLRMDEELKNEMTDVCKTLGITMTAAFTVFAKKFVREKGFPFDISAKPNGFVVCGDVDEFENEWDKNGVEVDEDHE